MTSEYGSMSSQEIGRAVAALESKLNQCYGIEYELDPLSPATRVPLYKPGGCFITVEIWVERRGDRFLGAAQNVTKIPKCKKCGEYVE